MLGIRTSDEQRREAGCPARQTRLIQRRPLAATGRKHTASNTYGLVQSPSRFAAYFIVIVWPLVTIVMVPVYESPL